MLRDGPARGLALALVSAAVLLLQISITRLLSVVLWYHWAFFVVSLTMLGVTAPGVWFSLVKPRTGWLEGLLVGGSILVPLGILGIVHSDLAGAEAIVHSTVVLFPGMLALGGAVCLLLLEVDGPELGRRYGCDLLGGFCGALGAAPLLDWAPTPLVAAGTGLLPLFALVLLRPRCWPWALGLAFCLALSGSGDAYAVRRSKAYKETRDQRPLYEKWSSTVRITVFDHVLVHEQPGPFAWGLGRTPLANAPVDQYWIEQDGGAGTPITRYQGPAQPLRHLFDDVTSVGYQIRAPATVAIIGAGGGRDVLTALAAGSGEILAIELNRVTMEALQGPFAQFSGHLYAHPAVTPVVGEGRSTLTRSNRRYDLIQLSLTDTWAATAAGAYALAENNLYTVEAYRLYWSRLSERGMVSTSRWMPSAIGLEVPRLLILVREALEAEEVSSPLDHLLVMAGGAVGTVLMSRSPFATDEIARAQQLAQARGFDLLFPRDSAAGAGYWVERVLEQGTQAYAGHPVTMHPPTDDRPFFFQVASPFRLVSKQMARELGFNTEGVRALQNLGVTLIGLTLVLFFLPFLWARQLRRSSSFWLGSGYFVTIGLSFMLLELTWVQRFVLYLGHPSLATTVTLGSLLLGTGVGALSTARVGLSPLIRAGWAIPLVLLVHPSVVGSTIESTLGWPSALRVLVASAMVGLPGILLGLFFPLGMVRFGERFKAWFWALNGAAGVMAGAVSLALCLEWGLDLVSRIAALLYGVAWVLLSAGTARNPSGKLLGPR